MIKTALKKIVGGTHLNRNDAEECMDFIMEGNATPAQIASFITALRMKGETVDEIAGFVSVMREKAVFVAINDPDAVDTCGTGGDGKHTLNVSTLSAFAAAGAGITVAKHGNRAVSSKTGSADLLQQFGVNIEISPEMMARCINSAGIGFLFAPKLHLAMKYAAAPRKETGLRTVFNILGPLSNPAGVKNQLIGVYDGSLCRTLTEVLRELGSRRAFIVHGEDGLDEISISAPSIVCELNNGSIREFRIQPEDFGFTRHPLTELVCTDTGQNLTAAEQILAGEAGAGRDIVLLNAGFAISASDPTMPVEEGIRLAKESIDSGKAFDKVRQLAELTNAELPQEALNG